MNNPIVVFDSGIGGLPYLVHLRDRLSCENFVYVADSKNFPYGNKNENDLKILIVDTIKVIIEKFNPKAIVIACNTASVTALKELRSITKIPIVGVVPAIKTAALLTKNRRIGILATKRTVEGKYLQTLIKDYSSENQVFSVGASDIVEFVERDLHNATKEFKNNFIRHSVSEIKLYDVDSVVLGCTHFIHVADEISKALGQHVKIIDSRDGVSRQTERVITLNTISGKKGYGYFYMTKLLNDNENYRSLCINADLEFRGEILY